MHIFSTSKNPKSSSSISPCLLLNLPNELILSIFRFLCLHDTLKLIALLQTRNSRLIGLLRNALVEQLLTTPNARLKLCFDQENRWKCTMDFKFTHLSRHRSTLIFRPIETNLSVPMYTSRLLCRPVLHRVHLVCPCCGTQQDNFLAENLVRSPFPLDVKEVGLHNSSLGHKDVSMNYHVSKTPRHRVPIRPGERWVQLAGFECSFEFLAQPKGLLQRVFDSLHSSATLSSRQQQQNSSAFFTFSARFLSQYSQEQSPSKSNNGRKGKKSMLIKKEMMPIIGGLSTTTLDLPSSSLV
ncbi:MAG: hypothetical protein EXX96DRAFT_582584 [Benjaminiella poitrasii]|nr:MAG: hypothetical protein EXX96DRAFT_582584 [Benjaminiella poitrasii]